jgi:excisionase family DNA binding protein
MAQGRQRPVIHFQSLPSDSGRRSPYLYLRQGHHTNTQEMALSHTHEGQRRNRWGKPKQAAEYSGWSEATVYNKLAAGLIRAKKDGRSTLIDFDTIDTHLSALPDYTPGRKIIAPEAA